MEPCWLVIARPILSADSIESEVKLVTPFTLDIQSDGKGKVALENFWRDVWRVVKVHPVFFGDAEVMPDPSM